MGCSKIPYVSRGQARQALKQLQGSLAMNVFLCRDDPAHAGYYHLGHKAAHKAAHKFKRRRAVEATR